jgi:hypothetical protein
MPTSAHPTAPEQLITEGRIAAIPVQSAASCALVIEALAQELARVHSLLGTVLDVYVHEWNTPNEVRFDCVYWQGWNDAGNFLDDLREDWPHLNV